VETMAPFFLFNTLAFLLGACLASFLMAWALRLPNPNETLLLPSRCRGCDNELRWYQLIPIFSWIIQGGRCGCRKLNLSPQYISSEIFLGLVFVTLIQFSTTPLELIGYLIFAFFLFFFFLTDSFYELLHTPMMLVCIALGLTFSFYADRGIWSLAGAGGGFVLLWATNKIFLIIRHKDGLGSGDKYLLAAIGSWVGLPNSLLILFAGSWLGALWLMLLYSQKKRVSQLPLGSLMVEATQLVFLVQYQLY